MDTFNSVFKLLAGIGLFLVAMYLLEESLKNLSGRKFKLFLQRSAKNKFRAVSGGAIITGILQSSSMVSLMVLAFVGAGVFSMKSAMTVILGANLGTTLDSWLVATLGFKVNIEAISYPAVFLGGLLLIIYNSRKAIKYLSYFLIGFGLLFIALSFMKVSMEEQVKIFDLSAYAHMSSVVYLFIGFFITLLVQSSSVTMALTLSALHVGAIGFPSAVAIVLGSETGTTIKIVLASVGGIAAKKRVALGNFLFNIFLTISAFIFLKPIIVFLQDILNITDPLIGLVTFSSLINLLAILIFLPFLDPFVRVLEKFFTNTDPSGAAFITHANVKEPETALDLFRKESEYFIHNSMLFNLRQFEIDSDSLEQHPEFKSINEKRRYNKKTEEEKYEFLKNLQGELQVFYLELRRNLQGDAYTELERLISALRNSMHAVKSIKDIRRNMNDLRRSSKDIKYDLFVQRKKDTEEIYQKLTALISGSKQPCQADFQMIFNNIKENYSSALKNFYQVAQNDPLEEMDMTTAINFNRELFSSNKAMLLAVRDLLLDPSGSEEILEGP